MKFTSEDLMKAMGLSVGDRIKLFNVDAAYTIIRYSDGTVALKRECDNKEFHMKFLLDSTYDILPRLKRVGDLKCKEYKCSNCPIKLICEQGDLSENNTLLEFLEDYKNNAGDYFDQEIHDLLKYRLDKEVE